MEGEITDPQALIAAYGPDAPVRSPNGVAMTLGQVLAAEALLCPADVATRQDPVKRVGYLARMLAAGESLRPEDHHLLSGGN